MKKGYFFRESALAEMLSFAILAVESIADFAESAIVFTESFAVVAAESTFASVLEALLQAAKEPIANTKRSFFI